MNLQILLYILLFIILIFVYAILYLVNKISKDEKLINRSQDDYKNSLEVIESAQKQANAIVEKAVESAKHILFETEYIKQDITKEMQDSLNRVAEETIKMVQGRSAESEKEFRTVVEEIKQEFAKEASNKLSSIEKITQEEADDFKQMLIRETVGSQQIIGKKIGEDFLEVQNEIADYKKAKMEEIDKNINAILKQAVKDIIGQSLTLPIQEDLIIKSLENAKKVGLFSSLENENNTNPTLPATDYKINEDKNI